jgi:hypothetical protein
MCDKRHGSVLWIRIILRFLQVERGYAKRPMSLRNGHNEPRSKRVGCCNTGHAPPCGCAAANSAAHGAANRGKQHQNAGSGKQKKPGRGRAPAHARRGAVAGEPSGVISVRELLCDQRATTGAGRSQNVCACPRTCAPVRVRRPRRPATHTTSIVKCADTWRALPLALAAKPRRFVLVQGKWLG